MKPPQDDAITLTTYGLIWLIGFASQLFRLLGDQANKNLTPVRVAAGCAAAGLASVIAVNLLVNLFGANPNIAIGIGGVFGWLGGASIERFITALEKRFGIQAPNAPTEEPRA